MYSDKNIYNPIFSLTRLVYLSALFLGGVVPAMAQSAVTTVKGIVTDVRTGETLIGVSVFFPGSSTGTSTDLDGNYQLRTNQHVDKVQFSYVGYKSETLSIKPGQEQVIHLKLAPDATQLKEVVITGSRRKMKYSNKNNPAVDLIREVVAHREENRPQHYDFVQYQQYEKTQLSLTNKPEKFKRNPLLRQYDFITDNLDTTVVQGKALLPFFMQEELSEHYLRKHPATQKTIVRAEKKVDFGEFVDTDGVGAFVKNIYQDIDIYQDNITLVTNQFLSPIANLAPTFYQYWLTDTITNATGQQLAELSFIPRNPTAFLFTGKLYVTLNGRYAVQRAEMFVDKTVSINWVKDLRVNLDFEENGDGRFHLSKSELQADFGLTRNSDAGFYGERTVSYRDFRINEPAAAGLYEGEAVVRQEQAADEDNAFWENNRHQALTAVEARTYTNIDSLTNLRSFKRTMDWATALIAGYKRVGPNIEIGPLNAFYSFNPVEGFRLRFGGRTTTTFSKKVMLDTYAAYGFKDEKWKYYVGGTYSLTNRSVFEFPVRAIRAHYQRDTKIPGQDLQFVQEDNFLLSFKRGNNDKWLYNETYNIDYQHEFENHFSYRIGFRNWRQSPAGTLQYQRVASVEGGEESPDLLNSLTTSEAQLELRWAPGEQFFQGKVYRTPVANRYPVFTLRAAAGIKDLFHGQYDFQQLNLNIYKRVFLSQLGYSDVVLEGGYLFGQVPFPLLSIHRANQTYSYQIQSYNLMNFLEFVSDQYASVNIDHCFNGFVFNKVPLVRKTRLREFATVKVLYGQVRDENMPHRNPELLQFPVDASGVPITYTLEKKPYVEASVGVGNIFNFFRVDVVRRFSYLEHPNVSEIGIRGRFKFDF
ncbi:DUF5686 and carboxypeptidase-like regulatory domain-containing protein [Pontibacter beigongshangensis]|uniref:DUF5686 and carboxypeptidase-like regulatory domain-containing protein n=1 Tax=Pontibacter beigongshangensis TaxID=2574733 RepID=UPI00165035A6|nr:DUF5686 and carboxypeptidase-like regulatory domain-containing protein [Pontibacter beigongshangensis]